MWCACLRMYGYTCVSLGAYRDQRLMLGLPVDPLPQFQICYCLEDYFVFRYIPVCTHKCKHLLRLEVS